MRIEKKHIQSEQKQEHHACEQNVKNEHTKPKKNKPKHKEQRLTKAPYPVVFAFWLRRFRRARLARGPHTELRSLCSGACRGAMSPGEYVVVFSMKTDQMGMYHSKDIQGNWL